MNTMYANFETMTAEKIRELLKARANAAGSQRKLAAQIPCSFVYLSEIIRGTRAPGPKILEYLGLEKHSKTSYSPKST